VAFVVFKNLPFADNFEMPKQFTMKNVRYSS